ncbi:hypothetical protein [Clavibacter michiganensis]|uniref:hypothetical protein n=1 Tax=Clavibacter michiganensis TaxID=28447 RepID=UPI0015E1D4A5|nr:hypothetical protein [Clavibacter michiganensis]
MRTNAGLFLLQSSLALGVGTLVGTAVGDPWAPCTLAGGALSFAGGWRLLNARRG